MTEHNRAQNCDDDVDDESGDDDIDDGDIDDLATMMVDDLMSYSHTHARTPDPGGNRMKATKPKTVNVDVDDDNDGDDIDDLATMSVVVALFTRSSQDAGLEATEPKSVQGATFKVLETPLLGVAAQCSAHKSKVESVWSSHLCALQ